MDIKIHPSPLFGEISAISSKSDVHRAAIAAALSKNLTKIRFTTLSEDINATFNVLRSLGASVELFGGDGAYTAEICRGECVESPTLDANECGTTARLILPVAAALTDSFTLIGRGGLVKRPFSDLADAMEANGVGFDSKTLPINASGKLHSGVFEIRGDISSQYISGLLFALPLLNGSSEIRITTPLVSAGYIDMTLDTLARFGISVEKTDYGFFVAGNQEYISPREYISEGDWSNACFWLAAGLFGDVKVRGLNTASHQKDREIISILASAGACISEENGYINVKKSNLDAISFCGEDIPDALPIIATALTLASGESVICGGSRLKIKESDRISTTVNMLTALGGNVVATPDGFVINGVDVLRGGRVNASGDHRIAMCASIAATAAAGETVICGAECVNKSYPTFFEDFARLGGKYSVING